MSENYSTLIKTNRLFGDGAHAGTRDCKTTFTILNKPLDISHLSIIESFVYYDSEIIPFFRLLQTTDGRTFIQIEIGDDNQGDDLYYEYFSCCDNEIPCFVYFYMESMPSERYDEDYAILKKYTIFIVYNDEIVKLSLIKEYGTRIEFESCDVHRMRLFNNSHLELKKRMFTYHSEIPNEMKGIEVRIDSDGREVIQVIEFNFVFDSICSTDDDVNINFNATIKMPNNFISTEISLECVRSSFCLDGMVGDASVSICIHCGSGEYYKESLPDIHGILIYQKGSTIVVVDDYDDDMINRIETAQYTHIGALIVSCKIPQFLLELKKNHLYCLQ